jgi:hypothetical protein
MPRNPSRTGTTIVLAALVAATSPTLAQNPPGASPANPTVPVAPPATPAAPAEKIVPPDGGTPSNRLSRQGGVINPPNIDPGMTVNPPKSGSTTTPVIPPPGSPGGNPSVVPK